MYLIGNIANKKKFFCSHRKDFIWKRLYLKDDVFRIKENDIGQCVINIAKLHLLFF